MKEFRRGKTVNMMGPLGNGYPEIRRGHTPLLIAGGTGVASIFSLAEESGRKSFVMYGARCRDDLMMLEELEAALLRVADLRDLPHSVQG